MDQSDKFGAAGMSHTGCTRKSIMFFFLFVFAYHIYGVCENRNAIKHCNVQNCFSAVVRESFLMVHLYSCFSMHPRIYTEGHIYTKNAKFL